MRVLFTLFPGAAHLYPVVPLARALLAAGHEVRVASHPELTGAVTAAGLAAVEIGDRVDVPALVGACASDDRLDRITDEVRYQPVRRIPYTGGGAVPEWLHGPAERPRVVLTLGVSTRKMFAEEAGFPVSELLEMVAGRDIELVATLDRDQLASVRSIPENVRTIDYVPLDQLLPTSSAIVHHGSVGTFGIAAAHRVPQLIVPVEGGDGVVVARYLEDRGAGLSMGTGGFTAAELWKNLERLLGEASFQTAADALHADSLASPSPLDAVPALEALTAHHRAGRR
ncbi:nucleotide disphospho-sugar-binding domain-containing protein [Streptomyces sp. NPDC057674]|uniref:nucleotide disphospho-sugar-binding domain-containing protein n=1 Tax=Streptomyces sp. NPDC057674 TaxID=3346203 RepID=UPI0036D0D165